MMTEDDRGGDWPRDGRPRLVHRMPWDLTVGGAQRMIDLWCSDGARRWETHVVTAGDDGPFEFPGAMVHPRKGQARECVRDDENRTRENAHHGVGDAEVFLDGLNQDREDLAVDEVEDVNDEQRAEYVV